MTNIPSDMAGKMELVRKIMEQELTGLQRYTLEAYFLRGMNTQQIAAERGVNRSTVWRTLRRAVEIVRRFLLL